MKYFTSPIRAYLFEQIIWATNGLISKFYFEMFTPSYFLQHAFQWDD
jgi:hypothetical protein